MTDPALVREAFRLKSLDRAGWLRVGIERPESVAGHSWGVAFLALLRCPPELNRERVLALAILHDLAEARIGDITPHDGVSREEKARRENVALDDMLADHPGLRELCGDHTSPEARFVKSLDGEDLRAQAEIYAEAGFDVGEFFR